MKTTVEIPDALLGEARALAARDRTTLRSLIIEGLRHVLKTRRGRRSALKLRDASVDGNGLQPGASEGSWQTIRDMIYEGRGG